jgi:uncharacterized protein
MIILAKGTGGSTGPVVACEPEVYRFDHRGIRFAFDPNTLKIVVLEEGETEDDLQDFARPVKPNFKAGWPAAPGCICFDVTRACNLRCSYCFAQNDSERNTDVHLTYEEAVDALSLILPKNVRDGSMRKHRIEFSFFGGEPLTRWPLIQRMVQHVEAWVPVQQHFHVTTNGTLITEEIAKFLSLHNFSTIVSVDGTEEAHNECRVRADGSGSYSGTIRGLELLKKFAPNVIKSTTLRSTFTPTSVKTQGIGERVAHLNDLVAQGLGSYVSVEPAFLGEYTCMDRSVLGQTTDYASFRDEWQKRYDDAADIWLERLKNDQPVHYHHFIGYARRMVRSLPNCSECGAAKGYFTIAPGGEIYACHHEGGTRVGNINTGGIESQLTAPWEDNRYYARLKCPTCPIRNICGGGCREYSVAEGLGVSMPVPNECELKWILFKSIAWLMAKTLPDEQLREKVMKYWGTRSKQQQQGPRNR